MTHPGEDYSDVLTAVEPGPTSTLALPVVRRRRGRRRRPLLHRVPAGKMLVASLLVLAGSSAYAVSVFSSGDGGAVREQAPTVPASSRPHPVVSAPPQTPAPAVQRPLRRVPVPVLPVPAPTSRRPVVTPRATHTPTPEPTEASPTPSLTPDPTPPATTTPAPPASVASSNRETPPC